LQEIDIEDNEYADESSEEDEKNQMDLLKER